MRKIIVIGEAVLDTVFSGGRPVKAMVGGRIANAAVALGDAGLPCCMVSECCADRVGDLVVDYLTTHRVDVRSIDRFTDGATALAAIFDDGNGNRQIVNYGRYPKERFDVVWPRIDEDDVLLFGSLYAVDLPQRERLFELVRYAAERKAILVYLPGFQHGIQYRITKVMPAILENLEMAHVVIAHDSDMAKIFPGESMEEAFHNHVEYYGGNYLHIGNDLSVTRLSRGQRNDLPATGCTANLVGWQVGFTAGVIECLLSEDITHKTLPNLEGATWNSILRHAVDAAQRVASIDNALTSTSTAL